MSTYLDDSEISRLNRAPAGERISLSPQTLEVLRAARRMAEVTDGAFDVTCRPLVELWREECVAAAEDMWLCSMSELTYKCDPGSDEPFSEDGGCEDESEAFGICIMGGAL